MSSKQEGSSSLWNVSIPKVTESPGGSSSQNTSTTTATNATEPAATKDGQRIHREGIEYLKEKTEQPSHLESSAATDAADRNPPPSSNPSSEDPSGGLSGKEAGGVAAVGGGAAAAAAASHVHHDNDSGQTSSSHLESSPAAVPNTQSSRPQPPLSNPSADDATGGIGRGHGGVSSAAYISSPVGDSTNATEHTGILGIVKSYLGLSQGEDTNSSTVSAVPSGAGEDKTSDLSSSSSSSSNTKDSSSNSGAYGYVAAARAAAAASTAAAVQERVTGSARQPATSEAASSSGTDDGSAASDKGTYLNYSGTANSSAATSSAPTSNPVDRTVETVKQYTTGTNNSSSTTSTNPTNTSISEESGTANPATDNSTTGRNMADTDEQPQKKTSPTDKAAATRENKDAIPTAGGERLGEKHWGESKIVPDNPKPVSEDGGAGVSSTEGQPNDETKANTAANIGGGSGPPGSSSTADDSSSSEPKTMDKIKDKLHIGSKKD